MKRNKIDNIKKISNYQYDNIFNVYETKDGLYFYNLYNNVIIDENIAKIFYKIHTFREGEYWTLLADKYYGDHKLWWVILIANKIKNPLRLPEAGTELKILNPEVVSNILNQILNGSNN